MMKLVHSPQGSAATRRAPGFDARTVTKLSAAGSSCCRLVPAGTTSTIPPPGAIGLEPTVHVWRQGGELGCAQRSGRLERDGAERVGVAVLE